MVRFIFVCMTLMAVSLLSIPVTSVYDGIQNQREQTIAAAEQPAQPAEQEISFDTAEPSSDDLNAIETAAGGFEDTTEDAANFAGGFTGTAPAALDDAAPAVTETPVDQAN